MCEARFIYILDLMVYHLLPIGNNFSIDKLHILEQCDSMIQRIRLCFENKLVHVVQSGWVAVRHILHTAPDNMVHMEISQI